MLLAIAIVLLVILGLFFVRTYLFEKFGAEADIVTSEKLLKSKSVAKGDFADDTLSGTKISGSAIRLESPGTQEVCGSAPTVSDDLIPQSGDMTVTITVGTVGTEVSIPVRNIYYVGESEQYKTGTSVTLTQTDQGIDTTAAGLRVQRGTGWVYFELGESPAMTKEIAGRINFSSEFSLKQNSVVNKSGEHIKDGVALPTGANDEVSVNPANNSITFSLVTTERDVDGFYVNYCQRSAYLATGYVQGTIDLGEASNLTRFVVDPVDVNGDTTKMSLTVALSKDGVTWTDNYYAKNGTFITFDDTAYADTFCYRYVRYRVNLRSTDSSINPGFSSVSLYGGGVCQTQLAASDVQCQDGVDNDGDGKIDYPDDPGCFSPMDDSEEKPEVICQDGTHENINATIELADISNEGTGDIKNRIYVDAEPTFYKSGQEFALVEDGVAVKDSAFNRDVPGVAVQRGNGWFMISIYGRHKPGGTGKETVSGKVTINGAGVKKVINGTKIISPGSDDWDGPFENQGDGKYVLGQAGQDEFYIGESIPESSPNLVEFYSTVTTDIDSFYIYYDYTSKVGGGCQCQDGRDNDGDGKIDYPDDPGCSAPIDDDERDDSEPVDEFVPECADGIDNDEDGLIDFPDDPGCYSSKDNSETNPIIICQDGSFENMKVRVNFNSVENQGTGNMEEKVKVGDETYNSGQWIDIVTDGVARIDSGTDESAPAIAMQRGKGWVFVRFIGNHEKDEGKEITTGNVEFEGTTITGYMNGKGTFKPGDEESVGPFDNQDNGTYELGKASEDEFFIPIGGREAEFYTTTTTGADSMYIYYDYVAKIGGGCECQDGVDNDGDGFIDYPNDPGCDSEIDDDESDNISDIFSEPGRVLPAAIKSGTSFYIIIGIVLLIGVFVVYRIVRSEENEEQSQEIP